MFDMLTKIEPREGTLIFVKDNNNIILMIDTYTDGSKFYEGLDAVDALNSFGMLMKDILNLEPLLTDGNIIAYFMEA